MTNLSEQSIVARICWFLRLNYLVIYVTFTLHPHCLKLCTRYMFAFRFIRRVEIIPTLFDGVPTRRHISVRLKILSFVILHQAPNATHTNNTKTVLQIGRFKNAGPRSPQVEAHYRIMVAHSIHQQVQGPCQLPSPTLPTVPVQRT